MNQRKRDLHLAELVEQELAAKTLSALAQEDIQFALDHQNDSLEQLQQYLRHCTEKLGHTPTRTEVAGGSYIDLRFGSWKRAVRDIGTWKSSMEYFPMPLENTKRYKDELQFQRDKRKADKKAERKAKRLERKAEQAVTAEAGGAAE